MSDGLHSSPDLSTSPMLPSIVVPELEFIQAKDLAKDKQKDIESEDLLLSSEVVMPSAERGIESSEFGIFNKKDLGAYLGAVIYGYWENARAMAFDSTGIAGNYEPGQFVRAQDGFQKLLDQNTGDGTIVALGFLGSEVVLNTIDKLAKKQGLQGFDPTVRFLSSVSFGVVLAGWLETTHIMNNTIDIPGDWFGVGLGAATILTSKIIAENATQANFDLVCEKSSELIEKMSGGFAKFSKLAADNIDRQVTEEDTESASLALATRIHSDNSEEE